jgi:PP-loop superfamily ATP-utilizing enzyme
VGRRDAQRVDSPQRFLRLYFFSKFGTLCAGSVAAIERVPEDLRALYKTAFEVRSKVLLDMAADRFFCVVLCVVKYVL